MTVALAATWHPRGELNRALRMIDDLTALYAGIFVVVPPDAGSDVSALIDHPGVSIISGDDWYGGRHHAVQNALASGLNFAAIHYCDFDRLLHWLERFPDELQRTVDHITQVDCLITGRTDQAWATHPRCMIETENIFNMTFSQLLDLDSDHEVIDFGAGSRGLSRRATEYLIQHATPTWGWAVDAAWPLLLHHAGYTVEYVAVDGLAWETPDQFRDTVADAETRSAMAAQYDQSPDIWRQRVHVAHEITRVGVLALARFEEKQTHG
ncbi:MAG: hypothetical protein JXA10_06835 [Anaerolineae bacterium]|nr:hypothetical protein [Anaerolineae bacterium]